MIDVSVIFVNYNTITCLIDAIDSVIKNTSGIIYELIVVDNNSSDNSETILYRKYNTLVRYIKLSDNIGFGRANNEGFKIAQGKYYLCLNPDTILINNAIKILYNYIDSHPNVAVVGSQLYNKDGSFQKSYSTFYLSIASNLKDLLFISKLTTNSLTAHLPIPVASVFGASMMIRSSVIENINGFDNRFFMYAEEEELCYRIKKSGYDIYFVPESKVLHLDGGSFTFSKNRELRRIQGEKTFYLVSYSKPYVLIVKFIQTLQALSRLIIFFVLFRRSKVSYWFLKLKNIY